jgi:transposase
MEATGRYSAELAEWIDVFRPSIVNPELIAAFGRSLGLRNKTDAMDARLIARYGAERNPAPTEPLSEGHLYLRDCVRARQDLITMRTAQKNRLSESPCTTPSVMAAYEAVLGTLEKEIDRLEEDMNRFAMEHQELRNDVELMTSIPGVGLKTALVLLGELGNLRRFQTGRALAAFAGLSPQLCQSGTSVHKRTRISKKGNPLVRSCLYMASVCAARGGHAYTETYKRLVSNGKAKRQALCAVARKTLLLCRALLIQNKPYEAQHAPS